MSKEDLIDSHVSLSQCRKAVEALHSHELKKQEKFEENQILPAKEQHIWLNVTVKTISTSHKLKPTKIPIVHPLVDPRTTPVCLITKDPQRQYKDLLESHNIKFISRVVGIEKLKGKFKPFEARRMLLKENGLFLADERVVPLLPKLLGSKWFEAKKQPIPVCLTRKDLKGELERAISSTYMNQNSGTCTSIKVGKMSQKPSQIIDNIKTALPSIVKVIKGGWDNIQSFNIKTNSSMSLPIWSCSLDDAEGGRWNGLQAGSEDGEDALEEGEESEEERNALKSKKTVSKSRKRQSTEDVNDVDEGQEGPRKKPKVVDGTAKAKEPTLSPKSSKLTAAAIDHIPKPKKQKAGVSSTSVQPRGETEATVSTAKKTQSSAEVVESQTINPEISGKKQKKSHNTISAPVPELSSSTPPTSAAAPPKSKKTTKPQPSSASASATSRKTGPSSSDSNEPTSGLLDIPGKKGKKAVKTMDTDALLGKGKPIPMKPTLTKEEMKQKRGSSDVLGKKKGLIAKAKGGKSVKDALLGRKAGQV